MAKDDLLSLLTAPFSTETAQLVALRGWSEAEKESLVSFLRNEGHPTLVLRPSQPWDVLAPLRHLSSHWQRPFPTLDNDDTDLSAAWLGTQVIVARFFLRFTESLRGCRTLAFLRYEDLSQPLLHDLFRMIRQDKIQLPISFLFRLGPDQPHEIGFRHLERQGWPRYQSPPNPPNPGPEEDSLLHQPTDAAEPLGSRGQGGFAPLSGFGGEATKTLPFLSVDAPQTRLSKPLLRYLGQALVLGEPFDPTRMAAISRADHKAKEAALLELGLLRPDRSFCFETFASSEVLWPKGSLSWRRKVARLLSKEGRLTPALEIWLRLAFEPRMKARRPLSHETTLAGLMAFGAEKIGAFFGSLTDQDASPSARLLAWLGLTSLPEIPLPSPLSLALPLPLELLAKARFPDLQKDEGLEAIVAQLPKLADQGLSWVAGLISSDLARWHLGHGRLRPAFQLLTPYKEDGPWPLRWLANFLLADAYGRMGRLDLGYHSLEKATACLPRPISPILAGDLRLLSARLHDLAGDKDALALQLSEARDVFRAAGDGVRLGRYLLVAAEVRWKHRDLEEARAFFGRALDLFRRYHDGFGAQEAQLKLGLVINGAPASILTLARGTSE